VSQLVTPPRLKIVQNQRKEKYKKFDPGTALLVPQCIELAKKNEPFYVVPVFFHMEWTCMNPLETSATLDMFRERTTDPNSETARKARDAKLRKSEKCPEMPKSKDGKDLFLHYVEHFVFIMMLVQNKSFSGMPLTISFQRGEWGVGNGLLLKLKARGADIFGCVFECRVPEKERHDDKSGGDWYGLDIDNPSSPGCPAPYVRSIDEYKQLEELHDQLAAQFARGELMSDLGQEDVDEVSTAAGETKF
jgi:hypothetical protein